MVEATDQGEPVHNHSQYNSYHYLRDNNLHSYHRVMQEEEGKYEM